MAHFMKQTNRKLNKPPLVHPSSVVSDNQVETTMRTFANHLIDRMIEIQKTASEKGLNVNKEKAKLIMEHVSK